MQICVDCIKPSCKGLGNISLIMKLPEVVKAWLTTREKLTESEKRVTFLTQCLAALEEEMKTVRRENTELRMPLLCEGCRRYLQSKHPGDTIEVSPCTKCIGIA